jgi:hypothetical protein
MCLHPCLAGPSIVPGGRHGGGLDPCGGKEAHVAMYEGYCVKDREKVQFEGTVVELKNGRKAAQGICPKCGTKVMRILGKSDA